MKAAIAGAIALVLAVICFAVPAHAQSQTITFSGTGGTIQYENGLAIAPGYAFSTNRSTGFVTPDGGMFIYLPDETYEISPEYANGVETNPVRGQQTNIIKNAYAGKPGLAFQYTETDTFTEFGWSGSVTYTAGSYYTGKLSCMRYRCSPQTRSFLGDFNGTLTGSS
jgi:hypothetical protein